MQRKTEEHPLSLRIKVGKEYLESDLSCRELARKYHISRSSVSQWAKLYASKDCETVSYNGILACMKSTGITRKPGEDTDAYIRRLEQSLKEAEDKAFLLQRVIEISEEELGVSLPKKPITKQSKK